MGKFINLLGMEFSKLTVICRDGTNKSGVVQWLCKCDCGNIKTIDGNSLRHNRTVSCGCWNIEAAMINGTKHGYAGGKNKNLSITYCSWSHMKDRCSNLNSENYKYYGGRGITVCERWLGKNGFVHFLEDMGERQNKKYTLERINNNLGYYKENCKWATKLQQARNMKSNRIFTINGEEKCLSQLAEEHGIKIGTLSSRINRNGWPINKALTTPTTKRNNQD
jgi:hypothetical protein